ncbi:hypothetical protein ACFO4U_08905 [Exiguobacterium profundum]|uniref:hypothetical protein n=1 Tax=Exiguobacterium TaxID=33986 RepID=UPI00093E7BA1|nr:MULTISPECIES: hypothetical protein [Exiguobacterium]QLQ21134.1 MAG: hypothetical protein HZT42_01085 [Paracoccaceae bacterium]QPI68148.1 hypothetical protein IR194_02365 [Exiguobacterium sp. PBE]MBG0918015.1 hypothetical protein [Exiguobacterium sp. SRB7LM]MCT4797389.1 hypothetical protein [Exiguobacterium profundum]MCV9900307.1 hypothetical protein [Exiguobacterium sp. N5]
MRALVIVLLVGLMTIVGCQQLQTEESSEENVVYEQNVDETMIDKRAGQSDAIAVSLERTNNTTMLFTIRMLENRRLDPTTVMSYEVEGERVAIPFGELIAEREEDIRTYEYQTDVDPDLFVSETLPLFHLVEEGESEITIPLEVINSTNGE